MAFSRPTLGELKARVLGDIETLLEGADAKLRVFTEYVLGCAVAGVAHGLHGHLVHLSRQLFPDTATGWYLRRWASIYKTPPKTAEKAAGGAGITGVDDSVCPADTEWQRNDSVTYIQDADATIVGGVAAIDLTAVDAGADGNAEEGVKISLVSPVAGIDTDGAVDADGLTGGLDDESDDDLRPRVLLRMMSPPKGGGPGDYVQWARKVAGVTRAWQYPNDLGAGTVSVVFVLDNHETSIIPDEAAVAEVQAYLKQHRPVTADVGAYAPVEVLVPFSLSVTPDTEVVRTAVEAQLADFFRRKSVPRGTLLLSQINEAISLAAGEEDHSLVSPAADLVRTGYDMSFLGDVEWL